MYSDPKDFFGNGGLMRTTHKYRHVAVNLTLTGGRFHKCYGHITGCEWSEEDNHFSLPQSADKQVAAWNPSSAVSAIC